MPPISLPCQEASKIYGHSLQKISLQLLLRHHGWTQQCVSISSLVAHNLPAGSFYEVLEVWPETLRRWAHFKGHYHSIYSIISASA